MDNKTEWEHMLSGTSASQRALMAEDLRDWCKELRALSKLIDNGDITDALDELEMQNTVIPDMITKLRRML